MNVLYAMEIVICFYFVLLVQFCYCTPYRNYSNKNNIHNGNDVAVAEENKNTGNVILRLSQIKLKSKRNERKKKRKRKKSVKKTCE